MNLELQGKINEGLKKINIIINKTNQTQVPLTGEEITKIVEIAKRYKLILPLKALNTLYDNKRSVEYVIDYIKPQIITFFNAKKLLTSDRDEYFDIKLLNLCIRVKKDILTFEDNEVLRTQLFEDFESFKVACKLYVWNVKLNECAKLNSLDDDEIQAVYNKNTGRLCRIANVPVKYEPTTDPEEGDGSGESSIIPEEGEEDGEGGENQEGKNQEGENQEGENQEGNSDQNTNQSNINESTASETDQPDENQDTITKSETFKNIEKFSISFTDEDYQYIVTTSIFIFIIFLMYITYK